MCRWCGQPYGRHVFMVGEPGKVTVPETICEPCYDKWKQEQEDKNWVDIGGGDKVYLKRA